MPLLLDDDDDDEISAAELDDAIQGDGDAYDDVGGFFGDLWGSTKKLVKSKIVKTVAGATAVVFPEVGVPLVAGLAVADKMIDVEEGKRGSKKAQRKMKRALHNTRVLAKRGNRGARKTIALYNAAKEVRATRRAKLGAMSGILITDNGRVLRGVWVKS